VRKSEDLVAARKLTEEDRHQILTMARDPRIGERDSVHVSSVNAPALLGSTGPSFAARLWGGECAFPAWDSQSLHPRPSAP
jgi:hypothetical protein